MAMRCVALLALSGAVTAIPTIGRQLQSAAPDKCDDAASFTGASPGVATPLRRPPNPSALGRACVLCACVSC